MSDSELDDLVDEYIPDEEDEKIVNDAVKRYDAKKAPPLTPVPPPAPKAEENAKKPRKPAKPRSEKQIKSLENGRKKRLENIREKELARLEGLLAERKAKKGAGKSEPEKVVEDIISDEVPKKSKPVPVPAKKPVKTAAEIRKEQFDRDLRDYVKF